MSSHATDLSVYAKSSSSSRAHDLVTMAEVGSTRLTSLERVTTSGEITGMDLGQGDEIRLKW